MSDTLTNAELMTILNQRLDDAKSGVSDAEFTALLTEHIAKGSLGYWLMAATKATGQRLQYSGEQTEAGYLRTFYLLDDSRKPEQKAKPVLHVVKP